MIGLDKGSDVCADGNYPKFANNVTDNFDGDKITWAASNIVIDTDKAAVNLAPACNPASYYRHTLDPAANLQTIVPQGAGVGKMVP